MKTVTLAATGSADIGGITVQPPQGVTTLTVVLSPDDEGVLPQRADHQTEHDKNGRTRR
jgi:hypothetical protein